MTKSLVFPGILNSRTRTLTPSTTPALPQRQAPTCGPAFVEVVLSPAALSGALPTVPGLTLKLWPQARLGDATLELRADQPISVAEMLARLNGAGITALGPVRVHH